MHAGNSDGRAGAVALLAWRTVVGATTIRRVLVVEREIGYKSRMSEMLGLHDYT